MNRKIVWMNVALLGLVALLVWQLRLRRQAAAAEERAVLLRRGREQAVLAPPVAPPVRPIAPADYIDTAQKMLFAKDRNPNVIVEVPPPPPPPPAPPPMPPLPLYYGQLRFGGPPVIELATAGGKNQKGYASGEKIAGFTIVSFDKDTITLEWNGEQKVHNLADLKPKDAPPPAQAAAARTQAPPASNGVIAVGGGAAANVPAVLGPDVGGGYYACQAGDTSPSGTIVNGYQKTSVQGLMGNSCRWERVK